MRETPENSNPILLVILILSHINLAIAEIQGGGLISYTLQLFEPEKQCNKIYSQKQSSLLCPLGSYPFIPSRKHEKKLCYTTFVT